MIAPNAVVSRTAARRLIRALPSRRTTTYSSQSISPQAVSMGIVSPNNILVTMPDLASSWTPPELDLCNHTKRDFVWHAGHMEQHDADELQSSIHENMVEMMSIISKLPKATYGTNHPGTAGTASGCNPLVQRILQKEHTILNLCQQYQQLTGEEYDELPQPHCDESATVLKMA